MMAVMGSPELMQLLMSAGQGEQIDQAKLLQAFAAEPQVAKQLLTALMRSGHFQPPGPPKQVQGPKKRKR
jgi:hypothetical protein